VFVVAKKYYMPARNILTDLSPTPARTKGPVQHSILSGIREETTLVSRSFMSPPWDCLVSQCKMSCSLPRPIKCCATKSLNIRSAKLTICISYLEGLGAFQREFSAKPSKWVAVSLMPLFQCLETSLSIPFRTV